MPDPNPPFGIPLTRVVFVTWVLFQCAALARSVPTPEAIPPPVLPPTMTPEKVVVVVMPPQKSMKPGFDFGDKPDLKDFPKKPGDKIGGKPT